MRINLQPMLLFAVALLFGCTDGDPQPRRTGEDTAAAVIASPRESNNGTAAQPASDPPPQPREASAANVGQLASPSTPDISFTKVVRLSLPGNSQAEGYAYDPQTGDLAIIGPWKEQLAIVSLEGQVQSGQLKNVELVKLLGAPHQLVHQARNSGGLFAVAETNPNGVLLVDVRSRQVVKAIKLADRPASFLPAAGPATPYLYFTSSDRQGDGEMFGSPNGGFHMPSSSTIEIQRLNFETMDLEASLHIRRLDRAGHAVFGDTKIYYWRDYTSACLHPKLRLTFHRNQVYDAEFTRVLSEVKCAVKTFLTDGPWVAGVTRDELVVCSINDGRIVTGIPIPSGYQRVAEVFLDTDRGYLVVGLGRHVVVVPLDKLDLPDEPVLLFEQYPSTSVELRETYEFPLNTVSGDPTVVLVEGPDGMAIEGRVLRWRPETAYTGPVDVKLKVTAGEATRELSWQITVE